MDSLLKSDIFFLITSAAVILLTLIGAVILFYAIRLIQHVEYIAKKLRTESDNVSKDIDELRTKFKEGGMKVGNLLGMLASFAARNFGGGIKDGFKKRSSAGSSKRKTTRRTAEENED